jgi:hypothetical protein
MSLKKAVSKGKGGNVSVRTADNHNSYKTAAKKFTGFEDNAVEADRRKLQQENSSLKSRLGAVENILRSGTNDRTKFMEGASWIAKKSQMEADRTINKLNAISNELISRT